MADTNKPIERISIFRSYIEAARMLPNDQQRLRFFDALFDFPFEGVVPDFDDDRMLKMAWLLVEPNLRKSVKNVTDGQKGGRPSKNEKQNDNHPFQEDKTGVFDRGKAHEKADKDKEKEEDKEEASETESEEGTEYPPNEQPSPTTPTVTLEEVFDFSERWELDQLLECCDLEGWYAAWQDHGWVDDDGEDMDKPVKSHGIIMPRWQSMLVGYEESYRKQARRDDWAVEQPVTIPSYADLHPCQCRKCASGAAHYWQEDGKTYITCPSCGIYEYTR